MIYPESAFYSCWQVIIILALLITCFITPHRLAFLGHNQDEALSILIIQETINTIFILDIIIIFNTALLNDYNEIIDNRVVIAKLYMKGWLLIDLLAVIPFDLILNSSQFNQLIRIVRIGRLYKLAKLTRLFRMLKLAKSHEVWLEKIGNFFKVSPGLSRLIFFLFISIIIIHVVACLWIMYPHFASETEDQSKYYEGTWLE